MNEKSPIMQDSLSNSECDSSSEDEDILTEFEFTEGLEENEKLDMLSKLVCYI